MEDSIEFTVEVLNVLKLVCNVASSDCNVAIDVLVVAISLAFAYVLFTVEALRASIRLLSVLVKDKGLVLPTRTLSNPYNVTTSPEFILYCPNPSVVYVLVNHI